MAMFIMATTHRISNLIGSHFFSPSHSVDRVHLQAMALLIFAGATTSAAENGDDYNRHAAVMKARLGLDEAVVFYPPPTPFAGFWAEYEPTAEEVAVAGKYGSAYQRTTNARLPDLDVTCAGIIDSVESIFKRHKQVVCAGFSNGVVVAAHIASGHQSKISGLLLCSGAPAPEQLGVIPWPLTVLSCGCWEKYFGGPNFFAVLAKTNYCDIVKFVGGHCQEDTVTLQKVCDKLLDCIALEAASAAVAVLDMYI
jgi:hypothetical protein